MPPPTPTPRCFNLPSSSSAPKCETTRFLCTVCQETCGFCQKHEQQQQQKCEDTVPERECKIFLHSFMANSSVVTDTPATGYCDAVLPPGRRPGTWRHGVDGEHQSMGGLRYGSTTVPSSEVDEYNSILSKLAHASRSGPIVFVGDSNMRYQYLTLAWYLRNRRWPARPSRTAFSVCSEQTVFHDRSLQTPAGQTLSGGFNLQNLRATDAPMVAWKWRTFYNQTNRALGGPQLEVCECEMKTGAGGQLENRFFEMSLGAEHQPHQLQLQPQKEKPGAAAAASSMLAMALKRGAGASTSVRLAFLGMQGNGAVSTVANWSRGWDALRSSWRSSCTAGACTGHRHRVSNAAFLSQHLAPLRPSMVIFGPGPWMHTKGDAGLQNVRSFLAGVKAVLGPRGRAIFRTCPRGSVRLPARRGCSNGASCDEAFRSVLSETGFELLDLYAMTDDLWAYIDQEQCAQNDKAAAINRTAMSMKRTTSRMLPPCRAAGDAFTDNFHFQCSVYREMNRWMLGQVFQQHANNGHQGRREQGG